MLVTEDGEMTGAISGGCLEGDALNKAFLAITQQKKRLVTYDTTDEDDAKLGIQLGCNGIVSILFEPVKAEEHNNPIGILGDSIQERNASVLINGYSKNNEMHYGTTSFSLLPARVQEELDAMVSQVLFSGISIHREVMIAGNRQEFFIEYLQPPVSLVIAGAGNDAMPLVSLSNILGWDITLVDGRRSHATAKRFPGAKKIWVGKPGALIHLMETDARTAVVIMTHNYNYDLEMLVALKDSPVPYIGLLGPAAKRDRLLKEMELKNIFFPDDKLRTIYGPTGLDIGAETSEEIALSITAEIMAVMRNKIPIHLKEKKEGIHQPLL